MKENAPTQGQWLNLNLGETDHSTSSRRPKEISHRKILKENADKWADRRCYSTIDRALRALIEGDL